MTKDQLIEKKYAGDIIGHDVHESLFYQEGGYSLYNDKQDGRVNLHAEVMFDGCADCLKQPWILDPANSIFGYKGRHLGRIREQWGKLSRLLDRGYNGPVLPYARWSWERSRAILEYLVAEGILASNEIDHIVPAYTPDLSVQAVMPDLPDRNHEMAVRRATQAVEFAKAELERERIRAEACLKYEILSEEETEAIVDTAEEALEDAQEDLAAILSADVLPAKDRENLIRAAIGTYTGPRNKKDRPRRKPFRVHAGIANVTFEEILRYSK